MIHIHMHTEYPQLQELWSHFEPLRAIKCNDYGSSAVLLLLLNADAKMWKDVTVVAID